MFLKSTALLVLLFSLNSCSLFNSYKLTRDVAFESKKICLTSEGRGRLHVSGRKYVFSFESFLDQKESKWTLGLDFPLHNQETFEIDWSVAGKIRMKSSIEDKLLRESSEVNPKELALFVRGIGVLLKEVIFLKENKTKKSKFYQWTINDKELLGVDKRKRFFASFQKPTNDKFGLISLEYINP
ncbi:MAG: hypothetical protein OIF32_11895, partial [Campylobacterales bacterium]|nr:hypothetical protein [Campylobacterales bacterium]